MDAVMLECTSSVVDVTVSRVLEWGKPDERAVNVRHLWALAFALLNDYVFCWRWVAFLLAFYDGY
jgi:hypothetical protein